MKNTSQIQNKEEVQTPFHLQANVMAQFAILDGSLETFVGTCPLLCVFTPILFGYGSVRIHTYTIRLRVGDDDMVMMIW